MGPPVPHPAPVSELLQPADKKGTVRGTVGRRDREGARTQAEVLFENAFRRWKVAEKAGDSHPPPSKCWVRARTQCN